MQPIDPAYQSENDVGSQYQQKMPVPYDSSCLSYLLDRRITKFPLRFSNGEFNHPVRLRLGLGLGLLDPSNAQNICCPRCTKGNASCND